MCTRVRVSGVFSVKECLHFLVCMDQTLKLIWGEEIFWKAPWVCLRLSANNVWKPLGFRARENMLVFNT